MKSLEALPGIGPRVRERLEKLLGPRPRFIDLLLHRPSQVRVRSRVETVLSAGEDPVTLVAKVIGHRPAPRGRRGPYKILMEDGKGILFDLVFFQGGQQWWAKKFPVQQKFAVSGKVDRFQNKFQITHPDYTGPPDMVYRWSGPETIYPLTEGIHKARLKGWIDMVFTEVWTQPSLEEWWDAPTLAMTKVLPFEDALRALHEPNPQRWAQAMTRLSLDELLASQLIQQQARSRFQEVSATAYPIPDALRQAFFEQLPFTFTKAQTEALAELDQDLAQDCPMIRLLQGDVGSGKTLLSFCAALNVLGAGDQVALLAPTEILARQHLKTLQPLCEALGLRADMLLGGTKARDRTTLLEDLAKGRIHFLVGTHALLEGEVQFKKLGFVIVDEQHRFGVNQRLKLAQKGGTPHLLAMSATPIPRSLALTLHGEMDISAVREKPPGRQPIKTALLPLDQLAKLVTRLDQAIERGEQAYWVCPLVESSQKIDLAAAEERYEALRNFLPHIPMGLIHGRLKPEEKAKIMAAFQAGEIKLLVSTTVIEVGVDVPQATIMIIEHGERFGLSQLHQLRGRVGRGEKSSSCVILHGDRLTPTAYQRLRAMTETEDGFRLAEIDLKIRGPGDFLGNQQSGQVCFRFADPYGQQDLLRIAHQRAREIVMADPDLSQPRHKPLWPLLEIFRQSRNQDNLMSG